MSISSKLSVCPYCKEEIAPGAVLCKHCGSPLKMIKKKKSAPFWRSQYMLGIYTGIIFMVLMIYLYNKIF
ncbi:MAG TPA: zinc ribbon domain-containing protein [candidate division Zixibacteria bacterium]|nr:zinc ribbon domain-containing protein [candidate division Zixibacteria bacterium]